MIAEWDAELSREIVAGDSWTALRAALGAFADARTLRALEGERRDSMMGRWGQDLRIAVRSLSRTPGFTAICVITLAVGLGGMGAVYTLLDRIILDPLPYPDSERLVRLQNQVPGVGPDAVWQMSTAQYVLYDRSVESLSAVGLHRAEGANVLTPGGPVRARLARATPDVLPMLGAQAQVGRSIVESDGVPAAEPVVVLSDGFWRRALGADPDIVGRTLLLDGQPIEVVGVLESGLRLPGAGLQQPDIWMPMVIDPAGPFQNNHVFAGLGLISEGMSIRALEIELQSLAPRLAETFPDVYPAEFLERYGFRTFATPLREAVVGDMDQAIWILFGGVLLVLLVAAANVSNLFLVRVETRRRELSVRRALGADRAALARYVLSESLVLAAIGGVLAVATGFWAIPALVRLAPTGLPRLERVALGWDTGLVILGASLLVGVGISVYPLIARNPSANEVSAGGRTSSQGPDRHRVRGALVVTQMALAVALLVGAGLLVASLDALRSSDPGFDAEGVVVVDLFASPARYPDDVTLWNLQRRILEGVRAIPGVVAAGLGEEVPVADDYGCTIQGFADETVYDRVEAAGLTTCAGQQRVAPGYFRALGIQRISGRVLEEADNDDPTRGAVVVSKAFADRFWPGEDPLGKGVAPSGRTVEPFYRVVGVVEDVARRSDPGRPPLSQSAIAVYYPVVHNPETPGRWGWWWPGSTTLVMRTEGVEPTSVLPAVRRVVSDIDPEIPLANARPMTDVVAEASAGIAFLSTLMIVSAVAALLLAGVGLYGVVSWVVSRQSRDIGMRLAVGATPRAVVRAVVVRTLRLGAVGLVAGLPLAYLTSRLARSVLVGVEPTDPMAYASAAGIVTLVSLLASWVPARRAAAVDPAVSLRGE